MTFKRGDLVWAHSDGSNIARGWHRAVVVQSHGLRVLRGRRAAWYTVCLTEYGNDFAALEDSLRPRGNDADTNLPTTWAAVPLFRPDRNWKRREVKT